MEFANLNERIERECQRIASCFGVEEWHEETVEGQPWSFAGYIDDKKVAWQFMPDGRQDLFVVGEEESGGIMCVLLRRPDGSWYVMRSGPPANEPSRAVMARGLYRLGFEDESILSQLPPLSAHERLKLRLSLPREFWPKTWLNEEERA